MTAQWLENPAGALPPSTNHRKPRAPKHADTKATPPHYRAQHLIETGGNGEDRPRSLSRYAAS